MKKIDWKREEERAREMSEAELAYARNDAYQTAKLWYKPETDPDGNFGFYMDQVSIYAAEMNRRAEIRRAAAILRTRMEIERIDARRHNSKKQRPGYTEGK